MILFLYLYNYFFKIILKNKREQFKIIKLYFKKFIFLKQVLKIRF